MAKLITVFGATGAQGSPVVEQLLAAGHRVRAVARSADRVQARHGSRVQAVGADLADAGQVEAALRGVDGAFAHLPLPTAPDAPQRQLGALITAARSAQLPQLVFSTTGPTGPRYRQTTLVAGYSAAAQAVLGSGVPVVVLQPTVYLENLQAPHFVPRMKDEGVLDYPALQATRRLSWTSHTDQARLAVAAFERPALQGRAYEIASPHAVTGPQLADLLSRWAGRPVRYAPQTPEDLAVYLGRLFGAPPVGEMIADLYRAIDELPEDGAVIDTDALADLFGVTLPTLAEHIARW